MSVCSHLLTTGGEAHSVVIEAVGFVFVQRSIVMSASRIRVSLVAAAVTVASLGVALPAGAIQRDACNYENVEIYSDYSTCWAWPGTVDVALYNTMGVKGGINSGHVVVEGIGYFNYYAYQASTWSPRMVTQVAIYG